MDLCGLLRKSHIHLHTQLCRPLCFGFGFVMVSHYVAQADLKFTVSSDPSASASPITGSKGVRVCLVLPLQILSVRQIPDLCGTCGILGSHN